MTIVNQGPTGYQPYLRLWIPAEMDASSLEVDLLGEAVTAVSTVGVFSGGELNDPLLPEDDPNDAVSGPAGYTLVRVSLPVGSLIDGGPGLEVNLALNSQARVSPWASLLNFSPRWYTALATHPQERMDLLPGLSGQQW